MQKYKIRDMTKASEMIPMNHMFFYIQNQLNSVFQTKNVTEMLDHIRSCHEEDAFLPRTFWNYRMNQIRDRRMLNHEHLPLRLENELNERHERNWHRQKREAKAAHELMMSEFLQMHDIGGSYEPIYLQYDNEPVVWPEHKSIQTFCKYHAILEDFRHDDNYPSKSFFISVINILK